MNLFDELKARAIERRNNWYPDREATNASEFTIRLGEARNVLADLDQAIGLLEVTYESYSRNSEELDDVAAKLQYLVDWCAAKGLLEDMYFTFPDGDTWHSGL